ncbi:MAG TPA: hypothetical protein VJT50_11310, partial [Pyrinomonadaceae bacterium]|nr:hypothetical protein [Pyrinomonadaceae bacterium]
MAATATTDRPALAAAPISAPLANLCLTFALTIVTLAVAGNLGGTRGYEMLIVGMGWPHVILGFLFYFGKVLNDEVQARSYFIMLALLTLILWSAHYSFTITGLISIYFTYHVFRDEVFIYFQTRARHKLAGAVRIAGLLPFILLMFFVTDPRPQYYRQDLRSGEIDSGRVNSNGWTLISFEPISYSGGKDFYFFVEARGSKGTQGLGLNTTGKDVQSDGEIRVADRKWTANGDLVFQPYYSDSPNSAPSPITNPNDHNHIRVSGDYRLGQTFRASRDNLAGMWISTATFADAPYPNNLKFHVTPDTSAPLPALSPAVKVLRWLVIVILAVLVLWKGLPHLKRDGAFWLYFFFFVG